MHTVSITVAAACFYVLSAATGSADEVPTLNVTPLCHGIAVEGTGPSEVGDPGLSFQACMEGEQNDRATLAKEWHTFSAQSIKDCTEEAQTGGESSYTDLLTCLEMAQDVEHYGSRTE
jgi:hypothetical protein